MGPDYDTDVVGSPSCSPVAVLASAADDPTSHSAAGSLETEVLAALWAAGEPLSAQDVRRRLGGDLAHTTINTILGRLHDKGAVERRASSRGYKYWPLLDRAGLTARRMQALLDDADPTPVLRRFVDGLDPQAMAVLRELLDGETERRQR